MKGFLLDEHGDLVMNRTIALVEGAALTVQTVKTILGTNQGEWMLNPKEGIPFRALLGKHPAQDQISAEIQAGLCQVDPTFLITEFHCERIDRILNVNFSAQNASGEVIQEVKTLAY